MRYKTSDHDEKQLQFAREPRKVKYTQALSKTVDRQRQLWCDSYCDRNTRNLSFKKIQLSM